jgi:hypothetical protein
MRLVALISLLFATLLFAMTSPAAQRDPGALSTVKNIYIESVPGQPNPLRESLVRELTKVGFDIVTNRSQADAALTVFPQAEIVIDGDGSIPDKSIYTYELALPNNTVVWKHRLKFVSRRNLTDDCDYAAVRMAAKLLKDKEASIRKGAHK